MNRQSGVVARWQLIEAGLREHDLQRLVRRRDLTLTNRGVYLDHTGRPTWTQEAWASVLPLRCAVLWGPSALRAFVKASDAPSRGPIHVAIDRSRSAKTPRGVKLHFERDLDARARWNLSPPRMTVEEAVLDAATLAANDMRRVATFADVIQARLTTADRIRTTLESRSRYPRRAFVAGVLRDIADGTHSVLEHAYLTRVERAHGLPRADRQRREIRDGSVVYPDATYLGGAVIVELDGRLFHDNATAYDADLERDLITAIVGRATIRLGYGQVLDRPCSTATRVATILRANGWRGVPKLCPDCPVEGVAESA